MILKKTTTVSGNHKEREFDRPGIVTLATLGATTPNTVAALVTNIKC